MKEGDDECLFPLLLAREGMDRRVVHDVESKRSVREQSRTEIA